MANRFPLIVNPSTSKIEELGSNDNLDLTNNNIIANGSAGVAGQYLKSNGAQVVWDTPGDVYLNLVQTLSNKTFLNSNISGSSNNIYDLPNSALQNPSITFNGTVVSLGGTYNFADENTTYSISAQDGTIASQEQKIVLTGANPSSTDEVILKAGTNVTLARTTDTITFNSSYVDTITRVQGGVSGTPVTGDVVLDVSGSSPSGVNFLSCPAVVTQNLNTISFDFYYENTITRLKGESAGSFVSGDVTFLQSGATTISQSGNLITVSSQDTITRVKGGAAGTFLSGDISIIGSGATSVTQASSVITVDSTNTVTTLEGSVNGNPVTGAVRILGGTNVTSTQVGNDITLSSLDTITRIRGTAGGSYAAGDFTFVGADDVQVTQSGNTITISSSDQDTITRLKVGGNAYAPGDFEFTATGAASVSQSGGVINIDSIDTDTIYSAGTGVTITNPTTYTGTVSLKNSGSLSDNKVLKWNLTNGQLVNSIITDDGSTVTIGGNLAVTGTTTTVNSTVVTISDSEIELRSGTNVLAGNGGIQVNRTTDGTGAVTSYRALQWFESGGYWRSYDGTTTNRFVTENETQTLTNKTLTSPTLTNPSLGNATAFTINKVTITAPTSGATLTIGEGKSLTVSNSVTLSGTDNSTISFGAGGTVIYASNKISALSSTTSDELRGVISDETGTGKLTFATSPEFLTSVLTTSTSFNVFNTTATTINAFGAATTVQIGATTGTTTIRNNIDVKGTVTLCDNIADTVTVNGTTTFNNEDVTIRGIRVGRGGSGDTNSTAFGKDALRLIVGVGAGTSNTAIGYETLYFNNSGNENTVVGFKSGYSVSTGSDNTALGTSSLFSNTVGSKNVAVGSGALYTNIQGNYNVCIGHYAGYGLTGSGNVLIGPAFNENSSDVTYQPPSQTGSNQLVIGSGGGMWLRGNSSYEVIIPNGLTSSGDFITAGTYTTLDSRILNIGAQQVSIADKEITIGDVVTTNFTATVTQGNTSITITSWGDGLIPGMVVVSQTGGVTVPVGTTITSIDYVNSTAVLSAAPSLGTGSATFQATGPSNTSADGGGLRLKGTTDKTLTWSNTATAWTANQHFNVDTGFTYKINNVSVLSSTTLGSSVVNSSLTSLGTLSSLTIASSGTSVGLTITNTGTGDCLVVNDEASDTTAFKIGNDGTLYVLNNISDANASTGTTNQVLARKAGGGVEWKGLNTLADPNTVTNAGTSTDNAIARFDLATGKIIQTSLTTIDDNGTVSVPTGQGYSINGTSVLNATTLGSGVTASSLTSVGTLTSLTVSGNATFDTNTLFVDSTNNRVGVGTTSATATLDVVGNEASGYIAEFRQGNASNSAQVIIDSPSDGESRPVVLDLARGGTVKWSLGMGYLDTNNAFHISTSTLQSGFSNSKLIINPDGNTGIGRSPSYSGVFGGSQRTLHIGGSSAPCLRITSDTASQGDLVIHAGNSGASSVIASLAEGGDIVFYTRPTGGSVTEALRIDEVGNIAFAAGKGIDFSANANASGMTSELLNDYEEGTWTPTIATESGSNYTISSQTCKYVKIGRTCVIQASITFSAEGSGTIAVIDLPFVADSSNTHIFNGYVSSGNNFRSIQLTAYTSGTVLIRFDDGTQYINYWTPNTGWEPTNSFVFTGSYITST
jgi:hypothetical protein